MASHENVRGKSAEQIEIEKQMSRIIDRYFSDFDRARDNARQTANPSLRVAAESTRDSLRDRRIIWQTWAEGRKGAASEEAMRGEQYPHWRSQDFRELMKRIDDSPETYLARVEDLLRLPGVAEVLGCAPDDEPRKIARVLVATLQKAGA